MAITKDYWDSIHYPELDDADNQLIRYARRKGWAEFYPTYPDAETQSRRTIEGAKQFLAELLD